MGGMLRLPQPIPTDESAFLAAVRAAPADLAPRLVFADWLDERNDPRGELIRIEEEMRTLPAFADRFWALKPRRNELRQLADPDWLASFGYGTVVRPLFGHGIPDDWKGRWRLIREFVERWHGIPMGDVGGHADKVQEAETRLGLTLPAAVREWVAFAQEFREDPAFPIVLWDVYHLEPVAEGRAISLLLQSDGDLCWGVRNIHLDRPDPPVYELQLEFTGDEDRFVPTGPDPDEETVSAFMLSHVWGSTNGEGGGFGVDVGDPAPLIRDLEATFPAKSRFGDIAIYETDDILVQLYREGKGLEVEVARPLPAGAFPEFLARHAQGAGRFHGIFAAARLPIR
jgi:uncharacterized protein (TIGR02996 family)